MKNEDYNDLLDRLSKTVKKVDTSKTRTRLNIPSALVIWVGQKSIFRNFSEFPKLLRRDPDKLLMFLAKELATAASLDGERAIFIGRKSAESFNVLITRYVKTFVICPVCSSHDTDHKKIKRLNYLFCEACGAQSSTG